jgi:FtsP/CotA-like multicopper oxidase with cupredoxin domain
MAVFILFTLIVPCSAAPLPGGTLDPLSVPQYVKPLVIPPVMKNDGVSDSYDIAVRQFRQQILPGGFPATTVWSYGPAADPTPAVAPDPGSQFNYPAYTIETTSNTPVSVRWINGLVDEKTGRFLPHLLPVDQTLHWANPPKLCIDGTFRTDCRGFIPERYRGPVPIVTHVHGAHVEGHSDGFPEAWFLPAAINIPGNYAKKGRLFDDATGANPGNLGYVDFLYRNDQPAATLWYHDHTLGMTRSNVYAGPAGFWLIRGGDFDGAAGGILPGPAPVAGQTVVDLNVTAATRNTIREIPIAIQDRSFNSDGSLFYPETRAFFEGVEPRQLQIPNIPNRRSDISPIWNPEAFFNVMVVNGGSWPQLEVAPALYRFRFLNGCNSRFLWLKFDNSDVEVYQVGAEQGFLPDPVLMNGLDLDGSGDGKAQLLIALAERADVIVDFRGLANGTEIELLNIGPDEPFGGGVPCPPGQNPDDNPGCGDFAPADLDTTGRVMRFVVNATLAVDGGPMGASPTDPVLADGDANPNAATDPGDLTLNAEGALDGTTAVHRAVSLNEAVSEKICVTFPPNGNIRQIASVKAGPNFEADCAAAGGEPFGPREALLGTVDSTGADPVGIPLMWTDMTGTSTPVSVNLQNGTAVEVNVTENPTEGDIEEWSMYNFTEDAHPIHLHLVRFQVVDRTLLDGTPSPNAGIQPWETGYKDTVVAFPGEITTVKALFDIEGLYVWHCHIVEHEDNEMMRPFVVSAPAP